MGKTCARELTVCMKVLENCFIETFPNSKLLNIVKEVILRIDNCLTESRGKIPNLGNFAGEGLEKEVVSIMKKISDGKSKI
jgi:hypothetical protein